MSSAATAIPTWADFNSLIQLSVGLNAAFATFSDFLGDGLSQEEKRAGNLIKSIEKLHQNVPPHQYPEEIAKDWTSLHLLMGDCQSITSRHDRFRSGFVRISGFACAFVGFLILIYASYNAATEISYYGQAIVFLMLGPFVLGASHGMYTSIHSRLRISKDRHLVEKRIRARQKIATAQRNADLQRSRKEKKENSAAIATQDNKGNMETKNVPG